MSYYSFGPQQNSFNTHWHRFYKFLELYWSNKHNSAKRYSLNSGFDDGGRELVAGEAV